MTEPAGEARAQSAPARLAPHLWALLGYFALSLVATYPTILHFTTRVTGTLAADRNQNLWNLWWMREALSRPTNPFHTDMLFYPWGADLYYQSLGLSHGLIGLLPLILWGLPAAYNTVVLAAFALAGYGAFRLCLLVTGRPLAEPEKGEGRRADSYFFLHTSSFLGGVVFAFTPYLLDAMGKGQTEVLSVQWIPLYAEAWLRAHRDGGPKHALLAGVFFALAAYGSLYYAVYLLLFTLTHIVYSLAVVSDRKTALRGISRSGAVTALVALVLALPLAVGLAANYNNPRLAVPAGEEHLLQHSADVLSLFAIPHDHPLLAHFQMGVESQPLRDYVALGYFALALATTGAVVAWRRRGVINHAPAKFWVALGIASLVLALGPQLQVGSTVTGVPLPFKLVEDLPGIAAIGKVLRFTVLARLCMAVLATWGAYWLMSWLGRRTAGPTALPFAALLALLLVELPIYPRYVEPLSIPQGFYLLREQPGDGALLDLPLARGRVEASGERMLYQTVHHRPIMGGYLSRAYESQHTDSCSLFWGFMSPVGAQDEGMEITSPPLAARLLEALNFYGIDYVALYNTERGAISGLLNPQEESALRHALSKVSHSPPFYEDDYVSLHAVDEIDLDEADPAIYLGYGWHQLEESGGAPFRWVRGGEATLCVFAPRPFEDAITFEGTALAQERQVTLSLGSKDGQPIFSGRLPPGRFTQVRTDLAQWPVGITEIYITTAEPGVSPQSMDPNSQDSRELSIGFKGVRLEKMGEE